MTAAPNIDEAIRRHGGEADDSVRFYLRLSAVERQALLTGLCSLRARERNTDAAAPRGRPSVVGNARRCIRFESVGLLRSHSGLGRGRLTSANSRAGATSR